MKQVRIFLEQLTLSRFKGIKKAEFTFKDRETFIHGKNGTGKTTLMDAFLWCLFGKDHEGRSDYYLKPYDKDGNVIHKLNSEVSIVLRIEEPDNPEYVEGFKRTSFRRVYHENWLKPKTETEEKMDGHSTDYYINDVKVLKEAYEAAVEQICSETAFRSITNPDYFPSLKKESQRVLLFRMAGDIPDSQIAGDDKDFINLLRQVNGSDFETFRKELASRKGKINDGLKGLPDRIDELKRGTPPQADWVAIEAQITCCKNEMDEINAQLRSAASASKAENDKQLSIQRRIYELEQANLQIESNARMFVQQKINALRSGEANLQREIEDIKMANNRRQLKIAELEQEKAFYNEKLEKLREGWSRINAEQLTFPDGAFECPTCKRPLEMEDIEAKQNEMRQNFNQEKARKIEENKNQGIATSNRIKEIEAEIEKIKGEKSAGFEEQEAELIKVRNEIGLLMGRTIDFHTEEYENNLQIISELRSQNANNLNNATEEGLKGRLLALQEEIGSLNKQLGQREMIVNTEKRIEELEKQKAKLNQELASLEQMEFVLKKFESAKNAEYESRINKLFRLVQFSLFTTQVNGTVVPDCICLRDGVPYGTDNRAGKMAAGLDIIHAMSRYVGLQAPIWIDNRESVTEIPPMDTQIINLVVNPDVNKLAIKDHVKNVNYSGFQVKLGL